MKNISENRTTSPQGLYFFRQRQKNAVFQAVLAFFAEKAETEGLTKKELARRLGKDPAQITRWFSGPGNWTLDTVSDLLFAMGAETKISIEHIEPLDQTDAARLLPDSKAPASLTGAREDKKK